jgi:uncharacterized membrane protein YfhO
VKVRLFKRTKGNINGLASYVAACFFACKTNNSGHFSKAAKLKNGLSWALTGEENRQKYLQTKNRQNSEKETEEKKSDDRKRRAKVIGIHEENTVEKYKKPQHIVGTK